MENCALPKTAAFKYKEKGRILVYRGKKWYI
jgi:hypothetical protein